MSIDYRTLLAQQIEADWAIETEVVHPYQDAPYTHVAILAHPTELSEALLDTRIPDLCPDCEGTGDGMLLYGMPDACVHPNAPTIADLLRWGENVAKLQAWIVADTYAGHCNRNTDPDVYAERLLAALRTEADHA